ncbi:hypothetical protein GM708_14800 [Vibrio cholerae]|nr:hypothetical protein [Vibrio cholerae]
MSDTVPPSSTSADKGPPRSARRILSAFLLPLFFVIAFPLLFVSALHSPAPNDLPLLVVGPNQVVADIATGLDQTKEFSATHTDVVPEARESVENRIVDGAIEVTVIPAGDPAAAPAFEVTTYVANAEGRAVASTVEAVGGDIATQLGANQEVVDVAPLAATDQLGTTLFYLLTYTSLGAYLVIIVLTQVMPGAGLRVRYLAVGCAAVIAPLLVFGLSSIWVGDYGASFGTIVALLGVNMLYVFTVGAAAILIQQFLGAAATFGVMAFIVLLNFPSAGVPAPHPCSLRSGSSSTVSTSVPAPSNRCAQSSTSTVTAQDAGYSSSACGLRAWSWRPWSCTWPRPLDGRKQRSPH